MSHLGCQFSFILPMADFLLKIINLSLPRFLDQFASELLFSFTMDLERKREEKSFVGYRYITKCRLQHSLVESEIVVLLYALHSPYFSSFQLVAAWYSDLGLEQKKNSYNFILVYLAGLNGRPYWHLINVENYYLSKDNDMGYVSARWFLPISCQNHLDLASIFWSDGK